MLKWLAMAIIIIIIITVLLLSSPYNTDVTVQFQIIIFQV